MSALPSVSTCEVVVIGGGPAGLMAAEVLADAGRRVTVLERMASPARKLLMAGRGGLNLTHSEPLDPFLARYGEADLVRSAVEAFPPDALVAWASGLGIETFVGTSGRVFPRSLKASPLVRAWLRRLASKGVQLETRRCWMGWSEDGALLVEAAEGNVDHVRAAATILALGGASWPRLGSDGGWVELLRGRGVEVHSLVAANAGVEVRWSPAFAERLAGAALKRIEIECDGARAAGEAVVTRTGLEGGVIYALTPVIRRALTRGGPARLVIDLRPDLSREVIAERLSKGRSGDSVGNRLRKRLKLAPSAVGLLREACGGPLPSAPDELAGLVKALPVAVEAVSGLPRAISSAGGVALAELDEGLMLRRLPGVFVAGEMLDWEAPTGGYLLQACFATGRAAGRGAERWLGAGRAD